MHEFDFSGFSGFDTDLPKRFKVKTYAEARIPNQPHVKQEDIPLEGKSIEDLILEMEERKQHPVAIWTYDIAEGKHKIFGQEVRFQSEQFNKSGIIFPDGLVLSKENIDEFFPDRERLRYNVAIQKEPHVVMLRNGGFHSFQENRDKVVSIEQLKAKRGKK